MGNCSMRGGSMGSQADEMDLRRSDSRNAASDCSDRYGVRVFGVLPLVSMKTFKADA